MPGLDPRAMQELALAAATSPIGGDFRYAMLYAELVDEPPGWISEIAHRPQTLGGKVTRLIWHERFAAALDSLGLCRRLALLGYQATPAELVALASAVTGRALGGAELARVGERIVTLERRFLLRYGYAATPDALPARWAEEPLEQGPAAGALPILDELLPQYYRRHGWDEAGEPTAERLAELGIT
jgi:aldehyde:ferredoxin oxidoreductase